MTVYKVYLCDNRKGLFGCRELVCATTVYDDAHKIEQKYRERIKCYEDCGRFEPYDLEVESREEDVLDRPSLVEDKVLDEIVEWRIQTYFEKNGP